jgi:hypothetical protein
MNLLHSVVIVEERLDTYRVVHISCTRNHMIDCLPIDIDMVVHSLATYVGESSAQYVLFGHCLFVVVFTVLDGKNRMLFVQDHLDDVEFVSDVLYLDEKFNFFTNAEL